MLRPSDAGSSPPAGAEDKSSYFEAQSLLAGKENCVPPPNFDWFDLIEYYAFRVVLLISFLYTLYEVLKRKLKG
jgi:hypothetical protein